MSEDLEPQDDLEAQDAVSFPLKRADSESFTGEAHSALLADSVGERPTRVYFVRFAPRSRTHWHVHSGTQLLLVQEGTCVVQREEGPGEVHAPGSIVRIPAGERHWHGAGPDGPMVHVALNLESARTEWQGSVTNAQYEAASGRQRR